jgi:hypothetical protein
MFLIIAFIKSFRNVTLVSFLEFFGHEHKFETSFENFLGNLFLKKLGSNFIFTFLLRNRSKYNLVMNFQS